MAKETENLIDNAIMISAAMNGGVTYEMVFHSSVFERSRMAHFIESKNEELNKIRSRSHK